MLARNLVVGAAVQSYPSWRMAPARAPILDENAINIFTDGSSYGLPRRGGCAFRIITVGDDGFPVVRDEQPYGYTGGTNQEMELMAPIAALNYITGRRSPYDLPRLLQDRRLHGLAVCQEQRGQRHIQVADDRVV